MEPKGLRVQIVDIALVNSEELFRLASRWPLKPSRKNPAGLGQVQHIGGRAALSLLVSEVDASLSISPEYGFSELHLANTKLHVSFSHTDSVAAAAVAPSPIGVDVESISRRVDRVLSRICTEKELMLASGGTVIDGEIVRNELLLWTAKEAVSKACGLGARKGLINFVIDIKPDPLCSVTIREPGPIPLKSPQVTFGIYRSPSSVNSAANSDGLSSDKVFLIAVCSEAGEFMRNKPLNLLTYPHHGIDNLRGE